MLMAAVRVWLWPLADIREQPIHVRYWGRADIEHTTFEVGF
jgi:hypothetical protein